MSVCVCWKEYLYLCIYINVTSAFLSICVYSCLVMCADVFVFLSVCVCVFFLSFPFFFPAHSLSPRHSQRLARTPHGHNSLLEKGTSLLGWQPGSLAQRRQSQSKRRRPVGTEIPHSKEMIGLIR